MKTYKTVYPYFEALIENLIVEINRNIEFSKFKDPNVFLHFLIDKLELFNQELAKKPAISNVNFEKLINSACFRAKTYNYDIEGVRFMVKFKEDADTGKFSTINILIPRK